MPFPTSSPEEGHAPENFLLWLVWCLLYEQSREGSDLLGVGETFHPL